MFGHIDGKPIADIFVYGDNIFSVFAYGNKMVIYRDGKFDRNVEIDSAEIEVMQIVLEASKSQIKLLARNKNTLKTYIVSLANGFQVTP